ncbi:fumarate hydratase [Cytobacillus purgationiresistens]|uniref:Fumarate hydratase subunit alpha n=1 Tax=Cytobacillus purgationiresistens TaxID=863449 RepID=A0ABU0AHZ0_9BACI|nr:fumarate hydratase [Cytobacillus purgationiresistens]MDQ0269690.1 fumarate hydratase subunit alpha [Cytobacillus purgationiresistens]
MRSIPYLSIVEKVAKMCQEANFELGNDVVEAFRDALKKERSPIGQDVLQDLIENANIASSERIPMCQDTGVSVFIVELGQACFIEGGNIYDAINEGVIKGYEEGYLRHSIVDHPLTREKSETYNTPAIIHIEVCEGAHLTIHMSAKGGGSENMSTLKMMKPSDGKAGVKEFILETVAHAGPNACPPLVVGIGIGGNFERCAYLAKKSLFRPIGHRSDRPEIAALELELMEEMNDLGIGPQGLGGDTTALDVKIEIEPCHIAALPVAVNLNCHASRHKEIRL